eukprot:TRINITY_DN732_c0_g3_i1.p1 TRINITY_DN732_c0_g3~~TRINITY_DN732_c0_g3_i1.p1  ORF type:complete len:489 (+),score=136.45 TRINITY_DN732_c0_g3_i1:35-1501(+)
MRVVQAVVALVLCSQVSAGYSGKIKHVVLLMEENRSFDHMMGFFTNVKLNGLKGDESNPLNTTDPRSPRYTVTQDSPYIGPFDPDHSVPATTSKIYGQKGIQEGMVNVTMDGFVEWEHRLNHTPPQNVMQMFNNTMLPVLTALSDEFAVFDRFFCSVPGPTWPNRLFQLMATSQGDTATSKMHPYTELYFGPTIFDQVESVGLDWKMYYADAPLEMAFIEKLTSNPEKIHDWWQFKHDIEHGHLPAFSWVNPRWFVNKTSGEGANDDHPDHDVRLGEALMKDVYEMLRVSPQWNETLFIITYDEHGGFYDHVPTPTGVPAPDNSKSFPDEFNFERLGVRIPVIAISPWIPKGTVYTEGIKPFPNSELDATSILSTMRKLFGFEGFLTKRDEWAATFEDILSEDQPRTDCPMHLPDAPKSLGDEHVAVEAARPLNHLQQDIVNAFAGLRGESELTAEAALPKLQGDGSEWISKITKEIMEGKHVHAKKM